VRVGYESWVERDVLMSLDADPGVEAVSSKPMWLHWVSESGKATRHAPDFFVRRADGSGVLIDVRADGRISDADSAVFAATALMARQAGWAYDPGRRAALPLNLPFSPTPAIAGGTIPRPWPTAGRDTPGDVPWTGR
jgi:hypothetical protein